MLGPLSNEDAVLAMNQTVTRLFEDVYWPAIKREVEDRTERLVEEKVAQMVDFYLTPTIEPHPSEGGIVCPRCRRFAGHPIHQGKVLGRD